MFTLVTGGLRSGKSAYALRRASELGPPPWLYVAPAADGDQELKSRLAGMRRDHEATWKPIEAPARLEAALDAEVTAGFGAVVIDRFTIWVSRRIPPADGGDDRAVLSEIETLADRLYRSTTPVVLVTMETGLGILPDSGPERRLTNTVGLANQLLADRAQSVVLMISGLAMRLR